MRRNGDFSEGVSFQGEYLFMSLHYSLRSTRIEYADERLQALPLAVGSPSVFWVCRVDIYTVCAALTRSSAFIIPRRAQHGNLE